MREIRPSGLEGGVAPTRHPYPYRYDQGVLCIRCGIKMRQRTVEGRLKNPSNQGRGSPRHSTKSGIGANFPRVISFSDEVLGTSRAHRDL